MSGTLAPANASRSNGTPNQITLYSCSERLCFDQLGVSPVRQVSRDRLWLRQNCLL